MIKIKVEGVVLRIKQFFNAIKKAIVNIADYKSRSLKSDYFCWFIYVIISSFIIGIIDGILAELLPILGEIIFLIFVIYIFVISLPLGVRRLHDIGKVGWFIFIGLIPIGGGIALLVFFCKESAKESNNWGESPKNIIPSDDIIVSESNKKNEI